MAFGETQSSLIAGASSGVGWIGKHREDQSSGIAVPLSFGEVVGEIDGEAVGSEVVGEIDGAAVGSEVVGEIDGEGSRV